MTKLPLTLNRLDHIVLTVRDIERTAVFYQTILGMTPQQFTPTDGTTRWALAFGDQKINLHQAGAEFDPKADHPTPGSADLCFVTDHALDAWITHLEAHRMPIEDGPVARTGALGPMTSVYIRDPDGNLLEISVYG